jgi:hypothetical protein
MTYKAPLEIISVEGGRDSSNWIGPCKNDCGEECPSHDVMGGDGVDLEYMRLLLSSGNMTGDAKQIMQNLGPVSMGGLSDKVSYLGGDQKTFVEAFDQMCRANKIDTSMMGYKGGKLYCLYTDDEGKTVFGGIPIKTLLEMMDVPKRFRRTLACRIGNAFAPPPEKMILPLRKDCPVRI